MILKKNNILEMIRQIDEMAGSDFAFDMEGKLLGDHEYTQDESRQMAKILSKIYTIAHSHHCESCYKKHYLNEDKNE